MRATVFFALVISCMPSCSLFGGPPPDPETPKQISVISQTKTNCEEYGTIMKKYFKGQEESDDYVSGEKLYARAKGAFNGWLDYTKQAIDDGLPLQGNAEYERIAGEARGNVGLFMDHVEKVCRKKQDGKDAPSTSMAPPTTPLGALADFVGLGNGILDFANKGDEARKTKLLGKLDALNLKSFDEL